MPDSRPAVIVEMGYDRIAQDYHNQRDKFESDDVFSLRGEIDPWSSTSDGPTQNVPGSHSNGLRVVARRADWVGPVVAT